MDFCECPEEGCGMIAMIAERYILESTDGPVEHARLGCVVGHRLNMPVYMLRMSDAATDH